MTLYDTLGVPKSASQDEVRMAYRKKAQKSHPDKGGSEAEFRQIQCAYDILSDPERKARYDQTGETGQGPSLESQALSYVAALLPKILDSVLDVSRLALIDKLKEMVNADAERMKANKRNGEAIIAKRRDALKRLSPGPMAGMLESEIALIEQKLVQIDGQLTMLDMALKIVSEHSYQSEAPMGYPVGTWQMGGIQL
jgi:curved DNA-binding protein CbpA